MLLVIQVSSSGVPLGDSLISRAHCTRSSCVAQIQLRHYSFGAVAREKEIMIIKKEPRGSGGSCCQTHMSV